MKTNPKVKKFITGHIVNKGLIFKTCKNSPID